MTAAFPLRVLIVDDQPAIHDDFRKILSGAQQSRDATLDATEALLFGAAPLPMPELALEIDSAFQGRQALGKVQAALAAGTPYALAFVDVRMPPGWDGVETVEQLWRADPALQIVLCTAFSDYSWQMISDRLRADDNLVILKKPFENIEVLQLTHALTRKWLLRRQAQTQLDSLERLITQRTGALETANAELRRSEERFEAAFRANPVALAIQRLDDQRFVDANDAFLRMTDLSREELVGYTPADVALRIDYEGPAASRFPAEPHVRDAEAQISTRAGEVRHARIALERIVVAGEPHVLLMAEDLSEHRRLEEQLRQAQKMEAIGQLAAGVAHDFNNLLTIIQGHTSLQLAIGTCGPDLATSLKEIEHAAGRAAELTRQLLAFSRRQILRPRPLDLSEHLQGLSTMLRRLIGAQIALHWDLAASLPAVLADPTNVEQILMNLAVNARDAMPDGGMLTVRTRATTFTQADAEHDPEVLPGSYVCLSVSDTGVGMDEATRARIFEPFFTTKDLHKGTGMGLATVYGIARQHGGWVAVATAPGEGSTFRVYLPTTAHEPAEDAAPPGVRTHAPSRQHTILVAEDEEAVRGLVTDVLIHHGYRVLEAEHAQSALEVWEKHADEIELLLTDIVMPGEMNGLDLARYLLGLKPELKVIYTSGYSAELFSGNVGLREGVNYLPKPYVSSKLAAIVQQALEPEED